MSNQLTTSYMDWSSRRAVEKFDFDQINASYAAISGLVDEETGEITIKLKRDNRKKSHFIVVIPDAIFEEIAEALGYVKET